MKSSLNRRHLNDVQRIKELLSYNILDTPPEQQYDRLTKIIATACSTPIALISLIDEERQWFKSKIGIEEEEIPVEDTICQLTIKQEGLFEIENTLQNDKVNGLPFTSVKNGVRYYAGFPITTKSGQNIGTVCVADNKPNKLSKDQKEILELITQQITDLLELRKKNKMINSELSEILKKKLKLADQQISQRESQYNLLYDAVSNSGIIMNLDSKGNIIKVNDFFEKVTGYSEYELLGNHYDTILADDTVSTSLVFSDVKNEEELKFGNIKIKNKMGESMWLKATFNPVFDLNGKFNGTVKVAHDITGEIESQQNLIEAKSLSDKLNIQKDKFIANMSHEIRTPINAIIGFTELLQQLEKEELKRNYINSIKNAGDKLLFIVNDILDLSQIEAGNFQIDSKTFNLEKIIESIFSILKLSAHKKKLEFNYEIDKNTPKHIVGDKNRLAQILINLLSNSLKFTEKGYVNLTVQNKTPKKTAPSERCKIEFKVSDTGIGIAHNKLSKIFRRFTQEDEDTSLKYGGTGLGLNISKLLVEKQKGKIEVKSEKGKGSEFTFVLPFQVANPVEDHEFNISLDYQKETVKSKVLLCEDNALNQRLIEAIFSQTNYELDIAQNGNIAIELLRENEYDLVLLDIQMPYKNGYQVIREIREDLKLSLPVIAVSAHSMIKEKKKCLELGMNDYLSKPFNRKDLLNTINFWLTEFSSCINHYGNQLDSKELGSISLERLKDLSGGDIELEKNIISLFIEESHSIKAEIKNSVKNHDLDSLNEILHKLKTSYGLIGANISLIEIFEKSLKEDTDKINAISLCLVKQIDKLVSKIKKCQPNYKL